MKSSQIPSISQTKQNWKSQPDWRASHFILFPCHRR
jgi:hypothetical protein